MNFFKGKKRKASEDNHDEGLQAKKPKSRKVVSWIKDKFNQLFKRNESSPFLSQYGETPANLKVQRYVLSPENLLSPCIERNYNGNYYVQDTYLSASENKHYEFKAAGGRYFYDILPEHTRKYGSGFLNSSGGILLAGIRDDGLVMGVYLTPRIKEFINNTVYKEFQRFRPKVDKSLYRVEFHNVYSKVRHYNDVHMSIRDLYIVELHVKKGPEGEIYEDGLHKVYIRREASVEGPLPPIRLKELVLDQYKKILAEVDNQSRKRKSIDTCDPHDHTELKRRKIKDKATLSPIVFDL